MTAEKVAWQVHTQNLAVVVKERMEEFRMSA
jgi:hypothetical protein